MFSGWLSNVVGRGEVVQRTSDAETHRGFPQVTFPNEMVGGMVAKPRFLPRNVTSEEA
jgi:hypothetical protein